jgi:eukaryotic-like serine/threonine-protein kinase
MTMATPPNPPSSHPPDLGDSPHGQDAEPADGNDALPPEPPLSAGLKPPATLGMGETHYGDGGECPLHIPGYHVLGELGHGGMGVVYKARQLQLGRLVALKMSRSGDMSADELARFRAEAEAVARLRHPNIVQIYDVGEWRGRPFFSFEYVDGGSLADFLRGTPQPPRSSSEMVEALARAIHVAHENGIIHRDLKPANVLLAGVTREVSQPTAAHETWPRPASTVPHIVPKITDFGVAKQMDKHSLATATGAILGTPNYMAPEQAWGSDRRRPIGPAADVYALGAILYEMLTGRPPFLGETPLDTLQQVVTQEPVAPTRLQPKIPKDIETICLKCLQKEPARRYVTAEALAEDLRRFLEDRPIDAKAAGSWTRVMRWRRRNPALAALVLIAVLLLCAGTAASSYFAILATLSKNEAIAFAKESKKNEEIANENAHKAEHNYRSAVKNARKAEERDRLFYGSVIAAADKALMEKDVGRVLELLDSLIPIKAEHEGGHDEDHSGHTHGLDTDLRGFEWQYLRRRSGGKPVKLGPLDGAVQALAFSPNAATVACAQRLEQQQDTSASIKIALRDVANGRKLGNAIEMSNANINSVAFRPDGKRVAVASDDGLIQVWEPSANSSPIVTCKGHEAAATCVQFSPDGKTLVSSSVDKTVRFWDAETGKATDRPAEMPDAVEWVAVHPKGVLVAAGCRDGTVIAWDKAVGKVVDRHKLHFDAVLHVAWHPNGKVLASASSDGTVRLWTMNAKGPELPPLRYHNGRVNQVAFSPDGDFLASVSDDKTLLLFSVATQKLVREFTEHTASVRWLSFTADGTLLLSAAKDGAAIIRPISPRSAERTLNGHSARVDNVAWNADGTMMASSRGVNLGADDPVNGSEVILWDLVANRARFTLTGHTQRIYHLAFQPKGKLLATSSQDGTVRLWDSGTGEEVRELSRQKLGYYGLAWNSDGTRLATTCDIAVKGSAATLVTIWDAVTGNQVSTFTFPQFWMDSLAWSPDSKWLAGASSAPNANTVWLWQPGNGKLVHQFEGHVQPILGLAFSADSRLLASASADNSVRLWDVQEKKELHTFKGHDGPVRGVAFHPDNKRLATASDDKQVKFWDLITHQEVFTLRGHSDGVNSLAFRPDGAQLATASKDATVRIWDATPLPGDVSK